MFDDSQVTIEEGCLKEFEDWEESWVWLCRGSKFLKIDVFADVYVWSGDELVESLHAVHTSPPAH
ncbi:transposase tnp2 [Pyrus ussuriensis x Pyrus communis]|uniref:Transposase tnp2 n=1 Tax=Pyrus ussuriensis x Pyrus communis TaxID=2448454 RepID=A0A5N5GX71_9ROSA|nr:transposase tnp2 [Pyrus ussuriensis x Pyrus communis]